MAGDGTRALLAAGALEPSVAEAGGAWVGMRGGPSGWELLAWAEAIERFPRRMRGEVLEHEGGALLVGPADGPNAEALRAAVPWLRPALIGQGTSVGTGDRLGIATPGHVAAFRSQPRVVPVLAQQSARELARTGRTFRDVVDAATYGALAAGWRDGYGADGDHLQTIAELDDAISAGCSLFTADPKALVPDLAADAPAAALQPAYDAVPWAALEDDEAAFRARYPSTFGADGLELPLPREALVAAAARLGRAVVQVVQMYRHVAAALGPRPYEFEVAIDEVTHQTTPVDHVYVATELRRLGVRWDRMAPRFAGLFEKGIDYLGDVRAFEQDVAAHAAVARAFGGYKISIHSGSDKFSIYDAVARATGGHIHLKTSGTSYLEALRTVAATEPAVLREVWRVALGAYTAGRASYYVSATPETATPPERLPDGELPGLLDDPNTREILHVTYGAVLYGESGVTSAVSAPLRDAIWQARDRYWTQLAAHIGRHLAPLAAVAAGANERSTVRD